ncbi:MAG: hypothetical protein AB4058_01900 [Microcystaceae cyanobacterium]
MFHEHSSYVSESHIVIPDNYWQTLDTNVSIPSEKSLTTPRLGELLRQAALISQDQLQLALIEQANYNNLKIGEILALHGWVSQETADFFAGQWVNLLHSSQRYPIGYYLEKACILNERQIQRILSEQKRLNLRFGEVAVLDGFLKPQTRDFFLNNLSQRRVSQPSQPKSRHSKSRHSKSRHSKSRHSNNESAMELAQQMIAEMSPHELAIEADLVPWIRD